LELGISSKRKLYTNEEEHIFSYIRRIILTGINIAARKPDLLDRCLLIHLSRLDKQRRKGDKEIQAILDHLRPKVLGSIFTILSEAFKYYSDIELTELPRMADFARWGEAISRAMGNGSGGFTKAYWDNIGIQNTEALEANPVGLAILHLTRTNSPDSSGIFFNGSATKLLDKLGNIADEELKISTKSKPWPKAPQALTRRINEIRVNLEEEGIEVGKERDSSSRSITIRKKRNDGMDLKSYDDEGIPSSEQIPSSCLGDDNDDSDGVLSFLKDAEEAASLEVLESQEERKEYIKHFLSGKGKRYTCLDIIEKFSDRIPDVGMLVDKLLELGRITKLPDGSLEWTGE